MSDTEIKEKQDAIDKRIGEVKTELLAHEGIAAKAAAKIAECELELTKLRDRRDELLTGDLFA